MNEWFSVDLLKHNVSSTITNTKWQEIHDCCLFVWFWWRNYNFSTNRKCNRPAKPNVICFFLTLHLNQILKFYHLLKLWQGYYYKIWIYRVAVLANTKFTTWHYFDFFFQIHLVYQEVDKIDFAAKSVVFLSVLVMIAGLFIYPLGFNSKFIRKHCGGGSSMYNSEQCEVGWGLVLAVVGTALAMFCPVLSHYTDMQTTDLLWCQASLLYSTSLCIYHRIM